MKLTGIILPIALFVLFFAFALARAGEQKQPSSANTQLPTGTEKLQRPSEHIDNERLKELDSQLKKDVERMTEALKKKPPASNALMDQKPLEPDSLVLPPP